MLLSLAVSDLAIASWETTREAAARTLPPPLEPAAVEGVYLVSIVGFRVRGGRLGRLPVPPFTQLNVRTYVRWKDEQAVFFLASRVTPPGLGGALLGAPYRPARIAVARGRLRAPGLGVAVSFAPQEAAVPGELGTHELGIFEAAGLRSFRIRRGAASWERGLVGGEARADPLLAHGFDATRPPAVLYAERAAFEVDVPPRPLA